MKHFLISEEELEVLRRVARRLHSEDRLDGDQMRDLGHALAQVVRVCEQIEVPEEIKP